MRSTLSRRFASLLAWGRSVEKQTGSPAAARSFEHHGALRPSGFLADVSSVTSVTAGLNTSGAVAGGFPFIFGAGRALGCGAGVRVVEEPRKLHADSVASFTLGESSGALISENSRQALVWGVGTEGQLGLGGAMGPAGSYHGGAQEPLVEAPRKLLGEPLRAIALARHRTVLLTMDGVVFCAGSGFHGELGVGASGVATAPASVVGLHEPIAAVAAGLQFTLAAGTSGAVFFFGSLGYGGSSGGGTLLRSTAGPVRLELAGAATGAPLMVAAGLHHALMSDGAKLWAMGAAWDGSGVRGGAPREVTLPHGVTSVTRVIAGPWTAAIIDGAGRAWVAGRLASPLLLGGETGPSAARALSEGRVRSGDAEIARGAAPLSRARLLADLGLDDEVGAAGGADGDGLVVAGGELYAPRLTRVLDAALEGRRMRELALGAAHAVAAVE